MRSRLQKYAPVGLYISLIAVLVSGVLYIIQREWNVYIQVSLGMIVVGLALFIIFDPGRAKSFITGRQARYGSNALIMTVAFIGILVVINYLVSENTIRWDLTEDKQNTLAPETIDTLKALQEPVEALAFYTVRLSSDRTQQLLDLYKFEGKGNFDYQVIDPEADPITAQNANITRDGTVVLRMGDRQEPADAATETDITAALIRLISNKNPAVYFLTGHGERLIDTAGETSYSQAKRVLESKNYKVESLNLFAGPIPDDAKLIVIAGPDQPLTQNEVDLLSAYVQNGGSLIVMEEPLPLTQFGDSTDYLAEYLQTNFGVVLGHDIVVDLSSNQPFLAVVAQYATHAITQKLPGLVSLLPTARSVTTISNDELSSNPVELAFTAENAWAETDLAALQSEDQQISPDANVDLIGRVPLAVAAENPDTGQRIVVIGDADFASDSYFTSYANGDLFINSVDWAAERDEIISLTPKNQTERVLVPPQRYTIGLILFGSVFFLPGAVIIFGVVVWIQRRKRG